MYTAEHIFRSLTYKELYHTLKMVIDEDCYIDELITNDTLEDFFYLLQSYDLTYISSDKRILLTLRGEKILQTISRIVELDKKTYKIKEKL